MQVEAYCCVTTFVAVAVLWNVQGKSDSGRLVIACLNKNCTLTIRHCHYIHKNAQYVVI